MARRASSNSPALSLSSHEAVISSPFNPWHPVSHILDDLNTPNPYQSYTGEKSSTKLYAFPNHLLYMSDRIAAHLGSSQYTYEDEHSQEHRRLRSRGLILHTATSTGIDTLAKISDFTAIAALQHTLDTMPIPRERRDLYGMLKAVHSHFEVSLSDLSGDGDSRHNINLTPPLRSRIDDFSALSGLNLCTTITLACMVSFSIPAYHPSPGKNHEPILVDLGDPGGIEAIQKSIDRFARQLRIRRRLLESLVDIIREEISEEEGR
jgi:hypothetical protein